MIWRWFIGDYVPGFLPLDRRERRAVRRRGNDLFRDPIRRQQIRALRGSTKWKHRLLFVVLILTPAVVVNGGSAIAQMFFSDSAGILLFQFAYLPFSLVLLMVIMAYFGRMMWRPFTLAALREKGIEICVQCDYWLRDLPDDTKNCPECGAERADRFNTSGGESPDDA